MFTIKDAFNVCLERVDYWAEVRNKNFAPEGVYLSRHDMVEKVMHHLFLAAPMEVVLRPEEESPDNKTWYFRCAKPEEYDEEDRIFFTKEIFTKAIDELLEPMANLDPDKNNTMKIKFKKLSEKAIMPTKGRAGDACFDLYAAEDIDNVNALLGTVLVKTNIAMEIPEGYFGKIYTRSGMALKGWETVGGVLDSNYRGDIGVILRHTDIDMKCINDNSIPLPQRSIKKGDRIAQLAIHKVEDVELEEVDELSDTNRGSDGYGSSGK